MATIDGIIYLIGGLVADATSGSICQKYDPLTSTWSQIASLPEEVNFTKWSVSTNGQYVFLIGSGGGYSSYPLSSNSYYYDPLTDQWLLESALPAPRGLPNALFVPGFTKLFFGGGNDGTSGTSFVADCWEGTGGVYIPVELSSFSASVIDRSVLLKWTTASETNNMGFEVEKAVDNDWLAVGFVEGKGTTTEIQNYSFTDINPGSGSVSYRLKQIDFDGTFNYSNIIYVELDGVSDFALNQNFPNPFNPSTVIGYQLPFSGNVEIKIYDVLGNEVSVLVDEFKEAGYHSVSFDADKFASGTYIYRIKSGEFISAKKMQLIR